MARSPYPVELTAPDITPYRAGNTGVEYVTRFESGIPGPHVMINAVTHGNEICGAIALDTLFRAGVRPVKGRLTLSFANIAAYQAFNPANPGVSRFVDEDFNRVWDTATLDGPRQSIELVRARTLRPVIDTVDLLLDLHSMQHRTQPLMLTGLLEKSLALGRRMGAPEIVVRDQGHAAGRRMRDYGGFADPGSPKTAILVECGQHWEAGAAVVAIDAAWRFLAACGILAADEAAQRLAAPAPPQRIITVTEAITIASDRFAFAHDYRGLEVIPKAGTVIAHDGPVPVRTPYDDCVLIMPSRRLVRGQTAVRLGRYSG